MSNTVWLFSYGTLRLPAVQRQLFGRVFEGVDDTLSGFAIDLVTITDPEVLKTSGSDQHPILRRSDPDGRVKGSALALTIRELEAADGYETADYVRISVTLASGREAFVYVHRDEAAA